MRTPIGEKLSPVLSEIEDTLWEYEAYNGSKPGYTIKGFRAAVKIFMSVLADKIWELQSDENIEMEDRLKIAQKCGEDVRKLVKVYTDIDTHKLYK